LHRSNTFDVNGRKGSELWAENNESRLTRGHFLRTASSAAATAILLPFVSPKEASALVKGNAPPPKKDKSGGLEKKCVNVEECQDLAETKSQLEADLAKANAIPPKVAPKGTKYLDVGTDVAASDSAVEAKAGDSVEVHFKVLKIGKRSYDGLSGEGTVVFSRGYGLEDDEKVPGDKSFKFKLGDPSVVGALNDAVPGMREGTCRRLSVLPQMGWEKSGKMCDGGPGGSGQGGELKTDYVVVPTATMVEQEACFDKAKLPFPGTYAQERRMAQRFDQSLIMEVELVKVQ